jgi:SPP1 family predicted phage head-tail adaptor
MSLPAGKLRHRVLLESPTYTQNTTTGEMVPSWTSEGTVSAAIEPSSAREFIAAQATQSQIDTKIIIRFRDDVAANWRATHMVNGSPGKVYNIHGALTDKDSGREYLTLPCSTGVNTGE